MQEVLKELWKVLEAEGEALGYKFTSVQVNKNFAAEQRHRHPKDTNFQWCASLGQFEGGNLCWLEGNSPTFSVSTRGVWHKMDGRHTHWVEPYRGDRYSLVLFCNTGEARPLFYSGSSGGKRGNGSPSPKGPPKKRWRQLSEPQQPADRNHGQPELEAQQPQQEAQQPQQPEAQQAEVQQAEVQQAEVQLPAPSQGVWRNMLDENPRRQAVLTAKRDQQEQHDAATIHLAHDCAGLHAAGWALRFLQVPFETVFCSDTDRACEKTCRANFEIEKPLFGEPGGDITQRAHDTLPFCDVYVGGFPCQGQSRLGKGKGLADPRTRVFWDLLATIRAVVPRLAILENVASLLDRDHEEDWQTIRSALEKVAEEVGYVFIFGCMDAQHHGLPMRRNRLWMLLFKREYYNRSFQWPGKLPQVSAEPLLDGQPRPLSELGPIKPEQPSYAKSFDQAMMKYARLGNDKSPLERLLFVELGGRGQSPGDCEDLCPNLAREVKPIWLSNRGRACASLGMTQRSSSWQSARARLRSSSETAWPSMCWRGCCARPCLVWGSLVRYWTGGTMAAGTPSLQPPRNDRQGGFF